MQRYEKKAKNGQKTLFFGGYMPNHWELRGCQKRAKKGQKRPKNGQNDENGEKRGFSPVLALKHPKMAQNGPKWPKNRQKRAKIPENGTFRGTLPFGNPEYKWLDDTNSI